MNRSGFAAGALLILAAGLLAGCANTRGPKLVENSHIGYNKAIKQVMSEELLLNVVRRRYAEAPQFVQVSSISTTIETSVDGSTSFGWDRGGSSDSLRFANIGGDAGASFSDTPTVTITPLSGEAITGPLTKRMSYKSIGKLADSGYRADIVMALMVDSFTNIRGPYFGAGNSFRPGMPEYVELLELLGDLFDRNELVVGTWRWEDPYGDITYTRDQITPENQISVIALGDGMGRWRSFDGGKTYHFTDHDMYAAMYIPELSRTSGDGARVIDLLNLQKDPLKKIWYFQPAKVIFGPDMTNQQDEPRSDVKMLVRSFYSVMNLLSYGVQVPPEDEEEGRALPSAPYRQAVQDGTAFDLTDSFVVHWSDGKPDDAFVAVEYRGKWFYIDNADYRSKIFFSGLYDLFNLEVVPASASQGPVLTLPVN